MPDDRNCGCGCGNNIPLGGLFKPDVVVDAEMEIVQFYFL